MKDFRLTIPRIEAIAIIGLLKEFEILASNRGIKFNKYTEEQLLEVLYLYRNWKTGEDAPF